MKNLCLKCTHYLKEPFEIKASDGSSIFIGMSNFCTFANWSLAFDAKDKPDVAECPYFTSSDVKEVETLTEVRDSSNEATKTILDLLNSDTLRIEKNIK